MVLPLDRDSNIRTHERARCASRACIFINQARGVISLRGDSIIIQLNDIFWTRINAQTASFAIPIINDNS
jgi:hypothetical protein